MELRAARRCTLLLVAALAAAVVTAVPAPALQPVASVTTGPATVSGVHVGGGGNYVVAHAGDRITVTGTLAIGNTGGAIDQVMYGWAGAPRPRGCLYTGGGGVNRTFSVTLTAPSGAGASQLVVNFAQNFGCSTSGWWNDYAKPVIAEVALRPPATVTVGTSPTTATVSNVALGSGGGGNAIVPGRGVTFGYQLHIATGATDGLFYAIGWAGSTTPFSCQSHQGGVGVDTSGTATTSPVAGAKYLKFGVSSTGCGAADWQAAPKATIGLVYVDRTL